MPGMGGYKNQAIINAGGHSMNPKYWWPLSIVFFGFIGIALDARETDNFDPESLPPPAAGTTAITTKPQYTCEGFIYSISEDGIKYVRESGGVILLTAGLANNTGFYQLGKYGDVRHVDHVERDSETSNKLKHALNNCNARFLPSGVYFSNG
jgi:hypothetical protein